MGENSSQLARHSGAQAVRNVIASIFCSSLFLCFTYSRLCSSFFLLVPGEHFVQLIFVLFACVLVLSSGYPLGEHAFL
jgi:hypothetical protein